MTQRHFYFQPLDLRRNFKIFLKELTFPRKRPWPYFGIMVVVLLIFTVTGGFCDEVTQATARQVAQNQLTRHIALYGHWNHADSPSISEEQTIYDDNDPVAYNFSIAPSGHILVAVDNALSPVLLYSTTSRLDADRVDSPNSIESWIVPELGQHVRHLNESRLTSDETLREAAASTVTKRIRQAWQNLENPEETDGYDAQTRSSSLSSTERSAQITVGPLLETAWGQSSPYNLQTPENDCRAGENTLAGCVATAWAQLMRYWQWPVQGVGSHTYTWNHQSLSADFGETTYDWENMPAELDDYSSGPEKSAVSLLIYHAGIAADMDFGCNSSGSSAWADDMLDRYFAYRSSMTRYDREDFSSSGWLSLIQTELDADPPRPLVISIYGSGGGHEAIVDGYQSDTASTDKVHINYGWNGSYDGYYDITQDFATAPYTWYANDQVIVTGIEPDNDPPRIIINDDQEVEEETVVELSGSATDPEGIGILSYLWSQTGGPAVTLSDTNSTNPTFTAPNVDSQTQLVFSLRVEDVNRGVATATCTVIVRDTDGSPDPDTDSDSDTNSETDEDTSSDPDTEPNADADSNTDADADTDSDPNPDQGDTTITSSGSDSSGGCFLNTVIEHSKSREIRRPD